MIPLVNEAPAVGDICARKHMEKGQGTNLAANSRLTVQDRGRGDLHKSHRPEAESKEKHGGVWDPMPELTIASPYVHFRVDANTFKMHGPLYSTVDLNPMPESTLSPQSGTLDLASAPGKGKVSLGHLCLMMLINWQGCQC
jgi:hypothetical protein